MKTWPWSLTSRCHCVILHGFMWCSPGLHMVLSIAVRSVHCTGEYVTLLPSRFIPCDMTLIGLTEGNLNKSRQFCFSDPRLGLAEYSSLSPSLCLFKFVFSAWGDYTLNFIRSQHNLVRHAGIKSLGWNDVLSWSRGVVAQQGVVIFKM